MHDASQLSPKKTLLSTNNWFKHSCVPEQAVQEQLTSASRMPGFRYTSAGQMRLHRTQEPS